ncbi:hypothetical protein CO669_07665 [Bradyrhizobium sp. Y36]|nr:hypothetical protein CO669_07665 [Bradyrhizobium sp. Y36]
MHVPTQVRVAEAPSPGKPVSGGIAAQTTPPPPAAPKPFDIDREVAEALNRSTAEALAVYETDIATTRSIEQSKLAPDAKREKLALLRPALECHASEARNLADANVEWQQRHLRKAWDAKHEAAEASKRALETAMRARHTVTMGTPRADAYIRSTYDERVRTGTRRQQTSDAYDEAQRHASQAHQLQLRVYHHLGVKPPPLPLD